MNLARLKPRHFARWSDDGQAGGAELVDDSFGERGFGSDYGQSGMDGLGCFQAGGVQVDADLRDSGISGRRVDLVTFFGETPGDRMLAAAAADDENFHAEMPV
jgi:hypothetical protein